jgi:hypothetical protein
MEVAVMSRGSLIVLLRDATDGVLMVETVDGGYYDVEEKYGTFYNEDCDINVHVDMGSFEYLLRKLFSEGKVDLTDYKTVYDGTCYNGD